MTSALVEQKDQEHEDQMAMVRAARGGDKVAQASIFEKLEPRMRKYALGICHDEVVADDIVGEVFLRLLEQFAMGRGPDTNLNGYLNQIVKHVAIDMGKEDGRFAPLEVINEKKHEVRGLENRVVRNAQSEAIDDAKRKYLSVDESRVLSLRFERELSLKDTGRAMDIECNNAKVLQHRGIEVLRGLYIFSGERV